MAAIPPNIELRLRFDAKGAFTLGQPRNLRLVSNQKIDLDVVLEQIDETTCPPTFKPIDLAGPWSARWIAKLDVDDPDAPSSNIKWDVAGSIVGPTTDGRFTFPVTKVLNNFLVEHGYSELVFIKSGADPDIRVPLIYSLTKQVLVI